MGSWEFVTVDVFTDTPFGGNALAVFPEAASLSTMQMQSIAREFNLSETTFVFPPKDPIHTAMVRIFTPFFELPFAGHPNVGTAWVLAKRKPELGSALVFEEQAGLVPVRILSARDGTQTGAMLTAPQPLSTGAALPADFIASCIGLDKTDIDVDQHPPQVASVGVPMVIVKLSSNASLQRARPDTARFHEAQARFPLLKESLQFHLYVRDEHTPQVIDTRMFAPLLGIVEDPATGSANAALAALLVSLDPTRHNQRFIITQGRAMGRPSVLRACAGRREDGSIWAQIGGDCVGILRGFIDL